MPFRSVGFKKPDGTLTGAIPEPNGLGLIQVKTSSGTQNVTALHINDGTVFPKLIWQPYTETQPEPTQPVGPCDYHPACATGTSVHYPISPISGTPRWNCTVWSTTAQTVNMSDPVLIQDPDWFAGVDPPETPEATRYCAKVYSFNSGATRPPPPTYLLVEYNTYTIADNFTVFIKNNYVSSAAELNQQAQPLFPTDFITTAGNPPSFDEKHGATSATYYYLNNTCEPNNFFSSSSCPCNPQLCTPPYSPISPTNTVICSCSTNPCYETGVQIAQQTTECASYGEYLIQSQVYPLLSIGCLGTTYCNTQYSTEYGCITSSCYGRPETPTPTDPTPSGGYTHRLVTKMPQNLYNFVKDDQNDPPLFDNKTINNFYNSLPTFNELAILSENGCDPGQCNQPAPFGCALPSGGSGCNSQSQCPSAYLTKVFTPFYVNVPSAFDAATGQTIDLRGKYIEFTKTNLGIDKFGGQGIGAPVTQYDGFPLLKQMRHILEGKKRACGIVLGIEHNQTDLSIATTTTSGQTTMPLYFSAFEFPKIQSGVSTQTHQVVIEIRNSNANNCQTCVNTGQRSSIVETLEYIRLYPITNTSGQILQGNPTAPYRQWLTNHITNTNGQGTGGINNIISYRYQGDGEGELNRETSTTTVSVGDGSTESLGIYSDIYNLSTGVVTPVTNSNNPSNLTYELLMNLYNQKEILTTQSTDCLCNPV